MIETTTDTQTLISNACLDIRFKLDEALPPGNTGQPFTAREANERSHLVCVKSVKKELPTHYQYADVKKNLQKEAALLRKVTHRAFPRVISDHTDSDPAFYICSFHPGTTLRIFAQSRKTLSQGEVEQVLPLLFDAIFALHRSGGVHCDLHAANVMIGPDVMSNGIMLLDLGSGHDLDTLSPDSANNGNIFLKTRHLQSENRQTISKVEAFDELQRSDLKAIGYLLAETRHAMTSNLPQASLEAYDDLVTLLENEEVSTETEILGHVDLVLHPSRNISRNEDLFGSASSASTTLTLPGHTSVQVAGPARKLVDTPPFQRLKRFPQLSFCSIEFPGAVHSRFEHALGVFGLSQRVIRYLNRLNTFRMQADPSSIRAFHLAALIHDLGHYPFAHLIEQFARTWFPGTDLSRVVSHENRLNALLQSDPCLIDALTQWGDESVVSDAINILDGHDSSLSALLDGVLDIDKIDYLYRDSLHCGLGTSGTPEASKLMKAFRWTATDGFAIDQDAVPLVERFVTLQSQMLSDVYWSVNVRAMVARFHGILRYIAGADNTTIQKIAERCMECETEQDGLLVIREEFCEPLQDDDPLKSALIAATVALSSYRSNDQYKCIREYKRNLSKGSPNRTIYETLVRLTETGCGYQREIDTGCIRRLEEAYYEAFQSVTRSAAGPMSILVDVPFGKLSQRDVLAVSDGDGHANSLLSLSHVNESVFSDPARYAIIPRVFVSPTLASRVSGRKWGSICDEAEKRFFSKDQKLLFEVTTKNT